MEKAYAKYIINDNITFKHAKGASTETGNEFHTFHEIIYFMEGDAKFISENMQIPVKPNTLIIIPTETGINIDFRYILNFDIATSFCLFTLRSRAKFLYNLYLIHFTKKR